MRNAERCEIDESPAATRTGAAWSNATNEPAAQDWLDEQLRECASERVHGAGINGAVWSCHGRDSVVVFPPTEVLDVSNGFSISADDSSRAAALAGVTTCGRCTG